jgi:hypothetical protein
LGTSKIYASSRSERSRSLNAPYGRPAQSDQPRQCVGPRKDKRRVDLISDALLFGRLWYAGPNAISNAIGYAKHYSRSHDAVISLYDEAGNVIETHEHKGEFKEP